MGRPFLVILAFTLGALTTYLFPLSYFFPVPVSRPAFSSQLEPLLTKNANGRQTLISLATIEFIDEASGAVLLQIPSRYPLDESTHRVWMDIATAEVAGITRSTKDGVLIFQDSEALTEDTALSKGDRVSVLFNHDDQRERLVAEKIARIE